MIFLEKMEKIKESEKMEEEQFFDMDFNDLMEDFREK